MVIPVESQITQNLHKIQKEGGDENFVKFTVDSSANIFIQLAGKRGDENLYAEAASNQVISNDYQLSSEQMGRIKALGWKPPMGDEINYHREWQAKSHEDLVKIALMITQTFEEGYGISPNQSLEITLNLD